MMTACGGGDNNSASNNNNGSGTTPTTGGTNPGTTSGTTGGTGGGTTGGTGGGTTGGTSSAAATNVYVANNGSKQVQGFQLDPAKGFTAVQGSPSANADFTVDADIVGNNLVVSGGQSLKVWTIDSSTGALTQASPVSGGYSWMAVSGSNLYAVTGQTQEIATFTNSGSTFTQVGTPLSLANLCFECGSGPLQASRDGKYVFSQVNGFRDVHGFAVIDRGANGALSNPRNTQQINNSTIGAEDIVVSNDNQWVYESSPSGDNIMLWHLDPATGKSSMVSDAAVTVPSGPEQLRISPDGKYLAALSLGANRVSVFSINSTNGALTAVAGSPFATGVHPVRMAFGSGGKYLFVICRGDGSADLFGYSVDASTGALMQVGHQTLGGDPGAVAAQ
jgi:6-phosphogluconolactonase (cycloisomerase 2 family)